MPTTGREEGGRANDDQFKPVSIHPISWAQTNSAYFRGMHQFSGRILTKQGGQLRGPPNPDRLPGEHTSPPIDILILASHRSGYELGELLYIPFGRIEGAHPAHDGPLLIPHIEEIVLLQLGDGWARNLREYSVGFHLVNNLHSGDLADFFLQQLGHPVGVLRVLPPQIVRE